MIKKQKNKTKKKPRKISKSFSKRKRKKQQYGQDCYKNLSKDEKQKLVEYRKKILKLEKMLGYHCKNVL